MKAAQISKRGGDFEIIGRDIPQRAHGAPGMDRCWRQLPYLWRLRASIRSAHLDFQIPKQKIATEGAKWDL